MNDLENDTSFDAIVEAQKIAFAPVVFQATMALRRLGILQLISKSRVGLSVENIAEQLKITDYGVDVLLEMAESANIVTKDETGKYKITKIGFFLNAHKMTTVNMDFINDVCYKGLFHLEDAIKTGKPEGLKELGTWNTLYEGLSQFEPQVKKSWFDFDHFYSDDAFNEALQIVFDNETKWLLDVGGNTGKWAMKCCAYDEDVKITIVDLPGQLKVALENAKNAGLENRITGQVTNLLSLDAALPLGADAIWMSQFLDCFSKPEIVHILKIAAKAMQSDTKLYIMETFTDRQEFENATYCLRGTSLYFTAMANGNSKMYRAEEMIACIKEAGLEIAEDIDQVGEFHTILVCVKP